MVAIRSILFVLFIITYISLVYLKGIGSASYADFAMMFGLNFFIFIPLRVYAKHDNDENFLDIVSDGSSAEILNILLSFIGFAIAFMLLGRVMDMNQSNLILGLIGLVSLLVVSKKVLSMWAHINNIALSVFSYGNIFDKFGSLVAYIGLITFMVLNAGCSSTCSIWGILFITAIMITLFSPIISSLIFQFAGKFLGSVNSRDVEGGIVLLFYIIALPLSIPSIHFSFTIPKDVLQTLAIFFSIPSVWLLVYTVNTMYLKRNKNILITLSLVTIFYSVIFLSK